MRIELTPIGYVISQRRQKQDDDWDAVQASISLDADRFGPEAFMGLEQFSHVEIFFFMDRIVPEKIEIKARHPRENPDWPETGIFAQRAGGRPNRIGATICRIKKVTGIVLEVEGLDALDGTPVLDIKPWMKEFAPRGSVQQPEWVGALMKNYWSY